MQTPKYGRVIVKLSGEALAGESGSGIDHAKLEAVADQIMSVKALGVEVGIVIGGGNFWRGRQADSSMNRTTADHMGMLATIINALAVQDCLEHKGAEVRVQTALTVTKVAEPYILRKAMRHLEKGRIVVFACGTGNPYFTTDSASALRAIEIEADVLLKGTRVDGVYTADPEKDPTAVKFDEITFEEVLDRRLKVMDLTAFTLCRENRLQIIVFDMDTEGNLGKVLAGEPIGTLVKL